VFPGNENGLAGDELSGGLFRRGAAKTRKGGGALRLALVLATTGLAVGAALAGAGTAWADGNALQTIAKWQSDGYQVNIDRVGSGPLNKCVVTSVRNPNTITRLVRVGGRGPGPSYLVPVIVSKTVQVSLDCTS
jgi:hypothetical protein